MVENPGDLDKLRQELEQQAAVLRKLRRRRRQERQTAEYLRNISHLMTLIYQRMAVEDSRREATLLARVRRLLMALRQRIRARVTSFLTPHLGRLMQYPPRLVAIPASYTNLPPLPAPPLISVVTPSYNQAVYLERTLKSVLDQNYSRLEYIVQDGGSTDDTTQILQRFQDRLAHWESTKDRGQSHAINLGFSHATGDILAYLNSDDLLLPGTLHYIAQGARRHHKTPTARKRRIAASGQLTGPRAHPARLQRKSRMARTETPNTGARSRLGSTRRRGCSSTTTA